MSDPQHARVAPVSAHPPLIDAAMVRAEAGRVVIFECLMHLAANVPSVVEDRDPEGLHQARVALRRLRAALVTFEAPPDLTAEAKSFTSSFGHARDLDVFIDELFLPVVATMGPQHGFEVLQTRAEHARGRAWNAVVQEVSSERFARFQDAVAEAAKQQTGAMAVGEIVPALLEPHHKRALKRGKALKDPHTSHRLRIALKRLRYAAEFFAPLYDPKAVKSWMEPLKDLQDRLGHVNDAAQVRILLGRLMMEETESASLQAATSHAAGLLQGWHQANADRVAKKAVKRWKSFKRTEPFWLS